MNTIGDATRAVMRHCPDPYAKAYARELLNQLIIEAPTRSLHTQALYVRANLSHWRGIEARTAKAIIDQFIKETDA